MADLNLALTCALAALAAGGAAAQLTGPLAADWRARKGAMKRRLLALRLAAPGAPRRAVGGLVLAATLAGGALAAYAAQPSAPERLAAEAAGVVGSGDQLALRLVQDKQERTLKPGDDYADGWKLDALTPTSATLTKDGERRQVGLNPTGALAGTAPAAPPSQVRVVLSDEELLAQVLAEHIWDGKTPRFGLTLEETKRWHILNLKAIKAQSDYGREMNERAQRAGLGRVSLQMLPYKSSLFFLGPDAPAFAELLNKEMIAKDAAGAAAFERYGPIQVKVGRPQTGPAGPDGQLNLYPETAQYTGALWRWSAGDTPAGTPADGSGVMTMRPPDPIEPRLYSTQANPPRDGAVKLMYLPADYKPGPGQFTPGVEGPEPPP